MLFEGEKKLGFGCLRLPHIDLNDTSATAGSRGPKSDMPSWRKSTARPPSVSSAASAKANAPSIFRLSASLKR